MNDLWIFKKQSLKFKEKSLEYKDQTAGIIFKIRSLKLKNYFFKFQRIYLNDIDKVWILKD